MRHESIAAKSVSLSHSLLGTVLAIGAVASGQEWAVGLAREGIKKTDWLANDTVPTNELSGTFISLYIFLKNFLSLLSSIF
jgi:hypothetical protein